MIEILQSGWFALAVYVVGMLVSTVMAAVYFRNQEKREQVNGNDVLVAVWWGICWPVLVPFIALCAGVLWLMRKAGL